MAWKEKVSELWRNHALLMVLCCLVPLLLLAAALYFGVANSSLSFAFLLLCPLMHFFLMKDMHKPEAKAGPGAGEKKCH